MDIFVTVMLVTMLLLVVIVGAAVFVQQSGSLRELRERLQSVQGALIQMTQYPALN